MYCPTAMFDSLRQVNIPPSSYPFFTDADLSWRNRKARFFSPARIAVFWWKSSESLDVIRSFISFIHFTRCFFPTFLHSIYKFYNISISYTKWCLFTSLPTSHIRKLTATWQSCCFRFVLQLGRLGICESSLRINMHTPTKNTKKLTWAVKMMGFQEESPFAGVYIFRCHVLFVWGVIRASVMKPNVLGLISPLCNTISLFLRQIVVITLLLKQAYKNWNVAFPKSHLAIKRFGCFQK